MNGGCGPVPGYACFTTEFVMCKHKYTFSHLEVAKSVGSWASQPGCKSWIYHSSVLWLCPSHTAASLCLFLKGEGNIIHIIGLMYGLKLFYIKQSYLAHEQVVAGSTSYLMPVPVTHTHHRPHVVTAAAPPTLRSTNSQAHPELRPTLQQPVHSLLGYVLGRMCNFCSPSAQHCAWQGAGRHSIHGCWMNGKGSLKSVPWLARAREEEKKL